MVAMGAGATALGLCIIAEPCGAIAWAGGSLLLTGGAIGTVDTIIELENVRHGTDHLPVLERFGEGFGGNQGRELGKNLQILWDFSNLTKSTAGMVNVIEAGGKLNRLEALDNLNNVDSLIRKDKK